MKTETFRSDPMGIFKSAKSSKVLTEAQDKAAKASKHAESSLHLQFCKWLKKEYPELQFVRHEREKARSFASQNMMKVYNGDIDKLPDFELLHPIRIGFHEGNYSGLYIEFKRPGRTWILQDGKTLGKEFIGQYRAHMHLWSIGRCAYFCNDFEDAKALLRAYLAGDPHPQQVYIIKNDIDMADEFLRGRGL